MSRCRLSYWHMLERVKILGRYIMRYILKGWETLHELEILTTVVLYMIYRLHTCMHHDQTKDIAFLIISNVLHSNGNIRIGTGIALCISIWLLHGCDIS